MEAKVADLERQIAKLEAQIAQAQAKRRDLKAKETRQERARQARRLILYGAAYLAGLKQLSEPAQVRSLDRVHAQITRDRDREFLGLPPLETESEESVSAALENGEANGSTSPELPFASRNGTPWTW